MSKSKLVVSSAAFAKALAQATPVVAANPVVPILENVLLVGTGSVVGQSATLQLVCTNFETLLLVTLDVECFENFAICVPAKKLLATLKGFPEGPLACEVDTELNTFEMNAGRSKYRLAGELPNDFPKMKPLARTYSQVTLPSSILATALKATLTTAAVNEQRTYFNAVLIEATAQELRIVACDGHTVGIYQMDSDDERAEEVNWEGEFKYLIPRNSAQLLASQLDPKSYAPVTLLADDTNVRLKDGSWVSRLVDEAYADYRSVIPFLHKHTLEADRDELLAALRRLSGYTPDMTGMALFQLSEDSELAELRAENPMWGNEGKEEVACQFTGEPLTIGFPATRLVQILSLWPGGTIRFNMNGPSRGALLTLAAEDDCPLLTCLVMPSILAPVAVAA